jgi:hypothetical protein
MDTSPMTLAMEDPEAYTPLDISTMMFKAFH